MKAYAIKDPKGNLLFDTYSDNYEGSKYKFVKHYATKTVSWKFFESEGYRCVPVEITEIKQEKKA